MLNGVYTVAVRSSKTWMVTFMAPALIHTSKVSLY